METHDAELACRYLVDILYKIYINIFTPAQTQYFLSHKRHQHHNTTSRPKSTHKPKPNVVPKHLQGGLTSQTLEEIKEAKKKLNKRLLFSFISTVLFNQKIAFNQKFLSSRP